MTVIENTATDPAGNPLALTPIRITLQTGSPNTPGYTGSGDIIGTYSVLTDATGHWSATLTPNTSITPANTYYQVVEGQGVSTFVVPASGGPYNLSQVLVTPPPTPSAPGITGVQIAAGGTVAGVRPELNLIAGTGVGVAAVDNAGSNRVDVTLTSTGGAPGTTVQPGTSYGVTSAVGVDATFAREDHQHGTPSLTSTAPATAEGIGQAAAVGTATTPARADHVHPMAAAATPTNSAVTDAAATGNATTFAASNHVHGREGFGTPGSSAVGDTATAGSAGTVSHSDHVHGREGFGAVTALTAFSTASASGSATTVSHSDHVHGAPALPAASTSTAGIVQLDGTAADIQALGAQAAGAVGKAADAGHVHPTTGVVTASQLPLSVANGGTGSTTAPAAITALGGVSWFNVQAPSYGAKGNGAMVTDAAMTAASATFTSATANFTSGDVGKLVQVRGAGAAGADLNTTISAFTNATTVTLALAAGTTVSAATAVYATDDGSAMQAAITASNSAFYGTVYLPPGIYMSSVALSVSRCMRIMAHGALIITTNSGALNLTNTYLSPTPGIFGRGTGLVIEGLELDCTGGHCVYNVNLSNFTWRDLVLTQRSSNFACVYHDQTGTNFIGGLITNVKSFVYGNARTMQAWHLVSHVGGGLALTQWTECLWQNQGTDTSQFLLWTEARGGTNYTNGLELSSCVFTSATGGGAAFWSAQGVVLENCRVVNSNNTTNGNSIYRVGTNTGSGVSTYTSQGITIIGCGRDLPGPDGSSTFDVHLDSSVDQVTIIGFECRFRNTDTAKTPFFNLNSATHVVVLDCPTAVITNPGNAIQIPVTGDGNTAATGDGAASFGSITLTTPLPIGSGGSGAATQQAAINALTGTQTAGRYLRSDGTNATLAAIQAGDVPTLNQSTTGSAASFTGNLAGDATGPQGATVVGAIQGVAITTTEATLVSDLNNATVRSASATLLPGEETIYTGSTASQTLTLPASPPSSSLNTVTNTATVPVTLAPNAGQTLSNFGTTGNIVIPAGYSYTAVFIGTTWYVATSGPSDFAKNNVLSIANGGTGSATQQAAINALTGTQTAGRYLRSDGTNATLTAIQGADIPSNGNVQTFTASGTWNKPAGATMVTVICIGAGGGGGSGAVEASGTVSSGGAGGGGGGYTIKTIPAALLSTSESVTVSATGGTGGIAVGTTASAGNPGGAGGATSFKSTAWAVANGGAGGAGGTTGAATGGTGGVGSINGGTGAGSSATGAAGGTGSGSNQGASGGGSGGGMATTPASVAGGAGGLIQSSSGNAGGTAGTSGGGTGGAGTSVTANAPVAGTGGGGGGSLAGGTGGTGGAGGTYGGGGGGGAGATTGQTSGAGGTGAGGLCVVISIN